MKKFIILLANSQRYFIHALRMAVFIVLVLAGGLQALSQSNYLFVGWGIVMMIAGILTLLGIWFHKIGLFGGLLITVTFIVSFIYAVIKLSGDVKSIEYLIARLSGSGQLIILLIAGLICASDSAKQIFRAYVLRMGKGSGV